MMRALRTILFCFVSFSIKPVVFSRRCYSFMGIDSCNMAGSKKDESTFSVPWFIINTKQHIPLLKTVTIHMRDMVPAALRLQKFEQLCSFVIDDYFEKLVLQSEAYLQRRGEPIELLWDQNVSHLDLYRSFKAHPYEVIDFLDELMEKKALDQELAKFTLEYRDGLLEIMKVMSYLPDVTATSWYRTLEMGSMANFR